MFFDNAMFCLFVCMFCFGVGEFLGIATKAKLSAVFVSLMIFLVCFMSGIFPPDIINRAGLTQIGKWSVGLIVFMMGTSLNLRQLAEEWRTVTTAVLSMIVVSLGCMALAPVIGWNEAVVTGPIMNGGIVATQVMTSAAMDMGLTIAAALGTIMYATQKFFGTPFASYFGLREAKVVLEEYRRTGVNPNKPVVKAAEGEAKVPFYEKHKKYYGPFLSLTIAAFFAWISFLIAKVTGLSYSIWCLCLGALISTTGLVPTNLSNYSKSSGLINMAVFAVIIPSLAKIKFGDLVTLSMYAALIYIVTFAVIYIFFGILPLWKIQGSRNVALGVAATQLLGFPSTYLIANEVAQAAAENEEEKQVVLDAIMSKYLVGGFATVTSLSIIMAAIMEKFLVA